MGGAIAGLTFLPPPRSAAELDVLRNEPRLVLVPGLGESPDAVPVSALHVDRGVPVTVLYSHANAEDLLDVKDRLEELSEVLNVNVLAYDYYGYGLTGGACSEDGCCCAARACLRYLLGQGVDKGNIVLMGRSLGTGPTVHLAAREPGVSGVVLQSPLLSVLRTRLSENMAQAMQQADLFVNTHKINDVSCPVFVMHGEEDSIVPREHGEEICRKAPNSVRPWWVEGHGHNDLPGHPDYYTKLTEFLGFLRARQRRQWQETVASFAPRMVVMKKPSTKLVLTAL